MAKYDVETYLTDLKSIFQSNLNNRITAINAEKTGLQIPLIPDEAWYFNHIPEVWSYNQFVVWGLNGISLSSSQPGAAIQTVDAFIEVAVQDKGQKVNEQVIYQLLRYSRSLLEVATKNHDRIQGYGNLQLESLSPSLVDISGKRLRMAGINLTASFDV